MTSTIYDSSKNTWKIRTINEEQHSNLFIIYLFICYFFPCEFRAKKIAKLLQSKLNCMEELSQFIHKHKVQCKQHILLIYHLMSMLQGQNMEKPYLQ